MNVLERIENKYLSNVIEYNHVSKNHHYVGYSKYFGQKIFIKIYRREEKYISEIRINDFLKTNRILDGFKCGDSYVLCFKYVDMFPVDDRTYSFYDCGKLLADFHKRLTLSSISVDSKIDDLPREIDRIMVKLVNSSNYDVIKTLYDSIKSYEREYELEFRNMPQNIIHGDFGFRNMKVIDDTLSLIDFEFVKSAIAYMDFIKFFRIECKKTNSQKDFLNGYNSVYQLHEPSDLLKNVLYFHTAIGIYSYTIKIKDSDFEKVADDIISDIKHAF